MTTVKEELVEYFEAHEPAVTNQISIHLYIDWKKSKSWDSYPELKKRLDRL